MTAKKSNRLTPYVVRERVRNNGPGGLPITEYQMDFRDPVTGKRSRPTLMSTKPTEAVVEAHQFYLQRLEVAGGNPVPGAGVVTVKDLLNAYCRRVEIDESTRRTLKIQTANVCRYAGESMVANNIDPDWIEAFIVWRRGGSIPGRKKTVNNATIKKELRLIWQAQVWGFGSKRCQMPQWKMPRLAVVKKKPRCLSFEELNALLDATGDDSSTLRQVVEILYLTGLRKSELLALRWDNVEWEQKRIRLVTKKRGGSEEVYEDYVYLSPRAVVLLRHRLADVKSGAPGASGYVFQGAVVESVSKPATLHGLHRVMSRFARKAGLRNPHEVGVHTMRHTCATHLLINQATPPEAAAHLRHRDGGELIFSTYGHAMEKDIRERVLLLGGKDTRAAKKTSSNRPTPKKSGTKQAQAKRK